MLSNGDSITGAAIGSQSGLTFDSNGNSGVTEGFQISDPNASTGFTASPSAAFEFDMAGVPEPATWAMMLVGFASLGFAGLRRTKTPIAAL